MSHENSYGGIKDSLYTVEPATAIQPEKEKGIKRREKQKQNKTKNRKSIVVTFVLLCPEDLSVRKEAAKEEQQKTFTFH